MQRVLLVAVAAVALAECSDMLSPPELHALPPAPSDFAVVVPPYRGDGGVGDMAGTTTPHDLSMTTGD